jgi:GNAT superfamily N-acetyltransferase
MSPQYELTESPPPEAFQKMWEPLLKFNEAAVGNAAARTLAVLLKDPTTDELIGGLWARSLWGSLYIDIMFVPEALRGTGIGTSLLRQAEQEAMRRGCREMWLDTYAFQARSLYEKFGFTVFGRLDGPAPIFPRFFLKKALDAKERTSAQGQQRLSSE